MAVWRIYGLRDPRTRRIRYVGCTIQSLLVRLAGHMAEARSPHAKTRKVVWLRRLGREPGIVLLARCRSAERGAELERRWIEHFGKRLTNQVRGIGSPPPGPVRPRDCIRVAIEARVATATVERFLRGRYVLPVIVSAIRAAATKLRVKLPEQFA